MNIFVASDFFASFHPKPNVANEPRGGTYFHVVLNEETWVLILINLHKVETIFEGHIAYFVDVLPKSLVAHPRLLPFIYSSTATSSRPSIIIDLIQSG